MKNVFNHSTANNYLNRLQISIVTSALCVLAMFYGGSKADSTLDKSVLYGSATLLGVGVTKLVHGVTSDIHKRVRTIDNLDTQISIQNDWENRDSAENDATTIVIADDPIVEKIDECILQGLGKTKTIVAVNGGKQPYSEKYRRLAAIYDTRKAVLSNGG